MRVLSKVYSSITNLQRKLYHDGVLSQVRISKPVLSVGNLTFGGTGKTPFVLALTEELKKRGMKPAIAVRSYGASTSTSGRVAKESPSTIWGDEACWYAQKTNVPVFSGPQKWQSAQLADREHDVDIVVLDDGFQHHKLFKDRNYILIDAVAGLKPLYERARDSVQSLSWANAVIMTRANLVPQKTLDEILNLIPQNVPTFLNETRAVKTEELSVEENSKILLVSGIANPESFELLFKKTFPKIKSSRLDFTDHHEYTPKDLEQIALVVKSQKLDRVIVTEKDEVKLKNLSQEWGHLFEKPWQTLRIESVFQNPEAWNRFLTEELKGLKR